MKQLMGIFVLLFMGLVLVSATESSLFETERDYKHDLIREPPPPNIVEEISQPPGKGYIWIAGHWIWQNEYRWQWGHWEKPPHSYSRWLNGNWEQTSGGWIWIPGRWT